MFYNEGDRDDDSTVVKYLLGYKRSGNRDIAVADRAAAF